MNIKNLRKNKKGFTLIEIIVVIVILAVLMAVAVPSVLKYMNEADDAKYMSQARGAMIATQTEVAKAYIAKETDYNQAYENAIDSLGASTPTVTTIKACTDIAGKDALASTEKPEAIQSYLITFGTTKEALITPNGKVVIQAAGTAAAAK